MFLGLQLIKEDNSHHLLGQGPDLVCGQEMLCDTQLLCY